MFHSKGLTFDRKEDGSVFIGSWLSGTANAGRADQQPVDVLDRSWEFTAEEWATAVAAVSANDSDDRFRQALEFHTPASA